MEADGENPGIIPEIRGRQDKSSLGREIEFHIRDMATLEIHGRVVMLLWENGLVRYELEVCDGGDCARVERVAFEGRYGNVMDEIKGEIRKLLIALKFGNLVLKEVRS